MTWRWYGSGGSGWPSMTSTMRVFARDGAGADIASWDVTIVPATDLILGWHEHVLTSASVDAKARSKDLYVYWQQSNASGSSQTGWNTYQVEVEVQLSLINPIRA